MNLLYTVDPSNNYMVLFCFILWCLCNLQENWLPSHDKDTFSGYGDSHYSDETVILSW